MPVRSLFLAGWTRRDYGDGLVQVLPESGGEEETVPVAGVIQAFVDSDATVRCVFCKGPRWSHTGGLLNCCDKAGTVRVTACSSCGGWRGRPAKGPEPVISGCSCHKAGEPVIRFVPGMWPEGRADPQAAYGVGLMESLRRSMAEGFLPVSAEDAMKRANEAMAAAERVAKAVEDDRRQRAGDSVALAMTRLRVLPEQTDRLGARIATVERELTGRLAQLETNVGKHLARLATVEGTVAAVRMAALEQNALLETVRHDASAALAMAGDATTCASNYGAESLEGDEALEARVSALEQAEVRRAPAARPATVDPAADPGRVAFLAEQARDEFNAAREQAVLVEARSEELAQKAAELAEGSTRTMLRCLVAVLAMGALFLAGQAWGVTEAERRIMERLRPELRAVAPVTTMGAPTLRR